MDSGCLKLLHLGIIYIVIYVIVIGERQDIDKVLCVVTSRTLSFVRTSRRLFKR